MATLEEFNEALIKYIKPQSYPVVARLYASLEEVPKRARFPKKDMNLIMPTCQAVGMVRRHGLTLALGIDDMNCPGGAVTVGFAPAKKRYLAGEFASSSMIPKEAHAESTRALPRLEYGKYKYLVMAPIHRANFEPHLVIIYGFPAQVALLGQSTTLLTGKPLNIFPFISTVCSPIFAATMLSDDCQVAIPCTGDRIFGSAEDYEIVFTAPQNKLDEVIKGLETCYKTGAYRYPTLTNLWFQSRFPESYTEAMQYLKGDEE